jgi:hypothetical protein
MMVMSASELTTLSPTSCGKESAYLDDRTKKKPAILTSRALISLPISNEPNEGRPVNASSNASSSNPQEGQPENSPGRAALLEEMRLRCGDHLDVPRFLALSEDGDVALFERRGSNEEWLSIGVTSISENKCFHFGWNSRRVSFCKDTEYLRCNHPEIFGWVVQELAKIHDLRAYRRSCLTPPSSSFVAFGETMARALGDDAA